MSASLPVRLTPCLSGAQGESAHAGFPEISYGFFSERLVALGYRVARVEQVETPQQLKVRAAEPGTCQGQGS